MLALSVALVPATPTSAATPADDVPPSHIRVCRDAYGGGAVVTVPFDEYVKTVLPFEYGTSGPREYLKAGAMAIKSYAWWYVRHPYRSRCDLTDSGRHQHYRPGARAPTAATNAAVDSTWHLTMKKDGEPLFAQYCGRSCHLFREGHHLDQWEADDQARAGWDFVRILQYHYRGAHPEILDWRTPLTVRFRGPQPIPADPGEAFVLDLPVSGVPPSHPNAAGRFLAHCTIDGKRGNHVLQTADVRQGDDGFPWVRFDGNLVRRCDERDVAVRAQLVVNGWVAESVRGAIWVDPWRSSVPRGSERIGNGDPVTTSLAVSRELFADAGSVPTDEAGLEDVPVDAAGRRAASTVVIARGDVFPDALSATGLAGIDGPILLHPGGPDRTLDDRVADEIHRILPPGSTVRVIGGEGAISRAVAHEPRLDAYRVARHWGGDRIATSVAVADAVKEAGGDTSVAIVVRGAPDESAGWADAVAVGPYAAARQHPVLVTDSRRFDPRVEQWILSNGVREVVVIGGPGAVSEEVEARLSLPVTRIAGSGRDDTAVAIAEQLWTRDGTPDIEGFLVIDPFGAGNWAQAVTGAVLGGMRGLPALATTHLVPRGSTGRWLEAHPELPATVVGSASVVSARAERDLTGR